jgi:hypothetical protein
MTKLTYEEWCKKYIQMNPEFITIFKQTHNLTDKQVGDEISHLLTTLYEMEK